MPRGAAPCCHQSGRLSAQSSAHAPAHPTRPPACPPALGVGAPAVAEARRAPAHRRRRDTRATSARWCALSRARRCRDAHHGAFGCGRAGSGAGANAPTTTAAATTVAAGAGAAGCDNRRAGDAGRFRRAPARHVARRVGADVGPGHHRRLTASTAGRDDAAALRRLHGVSGREVRCSADLADLDGLILPGGESTTMAMAAERCGLLDALRGWLTQQPSRPVWVRGRRAGTPRAVR